jgi:hypothetical protein
MTYTNDMNGLRYRLLLDTRIVQKGETLSESETDAVGNRAGTRIRGVCSCALVLTLSVLCGN